MLVQGHLILFSAWAVLLAAMPTSVDILLHRRFLALFEEGHKGEYTVEVVQVWAQVQSTVHGEKKSPKIRAMGE